jgi:serine/threonine-protein kinase
VYRLLNQQTGYCLDSNGDGAVYTLPCLNPNDHQMWQRVVVGTVRPSGAPAGAPVSVSVVVYQNRATERCLSLEPAGSALRTVPCPTDGSRPPALQFQRVP